MSETIRADIFGDPNKNRVTYEVRGKVAVLTLTDDNLNG